MVSNPSFYQLLLIALVLQQFPLMTYDSYTTYVGGVS